MCSRVPVIVILGATGSGKSKLGIEIARRFGGEIISADSMQAYKGLDIITNKVTAEERAQARHHLLDMVTPPRPFSVVEFRDAALPIVERLLKQNQVPVVVGGTNYYIESLLWRVLVSSEPNLVPVGGGATDAPASSSEERSKEDEVGSSTELQKEGVSSTHLQKEGVSSTHLQKEGDFSADLGAADTTTTTTTAPSTTTAYATITRASTTVTAADTTTTSVSKDDDVSDVESIGPTSGTSSSKVVNFEPGAVDSDRDVAAASSSVVDIMLPDEPLLKRARLDDSVESLSSPELHRRLQEVDPDMARRLHPNNRRRIIRSLQVFSQLGRPHSEVLREQTCQEGGGALGGPLRYPHSVIFWLKCDQATLDARLDARVDDMMQRGLLEEMLDFHQRYNAERLAQNKDADYTTGIFQSIGFKEFHEYLLLQEAERESERGRRMFQEAVAALKMVTRRYARKQVRWVVNRFLRQPLRQVPPVYAFDTSDPSQWDDVVYKPAVHVVECLLSGKESTDIKPLPLEEPLSNEPTSFHCEVCDRVFIGTIQWQAHITSKKHKKVLQQKAKAAEMSITSRNEEQENEGREDNKSVLTNSESPDEQEHK